MTDGISNPGIPLSRNFVPVASSARAVTREQQGSGAPVRTSAVGTHSIGNAAEVGRQKADRSSKTPGDNTTSAVADSLAFANAIAAFLDTKVSFTYDERIEQIVVKVTEGEREEVIRQIPSEEMIKLTVQLRKDFRGLIFNRTG